MSNDLIPADMQVPAHLAKRINQPSQLAQDMAGGMSGESIPKISIKSSRFRIIEDGSEVVLESTTLEAIIVGANPQISKVFYSGHGVLMLIQAPDCFSLDGIAPDASCVKKENDICATCPNNQWGSKIVDDKELKACADKKRLAIVSADYPDGTVYLLEVTPAALKNLNQYQKELTARGIPVDVVKTLVTFDTDASFPKLVFKFGGFLDEATMEIAEALQGSDEVLVATGQKSFGHTALPAPDDGDDVDEEAAQKAAAEAAAAETQRLADEKAAAAKEKKEKAAAAKKEKAAAAKKEKAAAGEAKGGFGGKKAAEKPAASESKGGFGGKKAAEKPAAATEKAAAETPSTTAKADSAASEDALSLASEIDDLLGDDFDG